MFDADIKGMRQRVHVYMTPSQGGILKKNNNKEIC